MKYSIINKGDIVLCPFSNSEPTHPEKAEEWRIGIHIQTNHKAQAYFPNEIQVLIGNEIIFFPPGWLKNYSSPSP